MTSRALTVPFAALALATLAFAGCREGQAIDDVTDEPPPSAQDEFNYEDVDDAEQAVDDSLENIGGRDAPRTPPESTRTPSEER